MGARSSLPSATATESRPSRGPNCCAISNAVACAHRCWPSATARWVSGVRCARYFQRVGNSINRRDPFGLDYIGVDGPTVPDWAQPPPVTCLVPSLFGGCLIWAATPTGSGKEKAFLPAPNRMRVQLQRGLSDRPEDNYGVSLEDDTGRGVTALDVKFAVIELSWDYRTSNAIREAIAAWFPEIQRELSAIVLSGGVSGFKRSFRSWPLPNGWRLDLDQLAGTNLTSED